MNSEIFFCEEGAVLVHWEAGLVCRAVHLVEVHVALICVLLLGHQVLLEVLTL